MESEIGLGAWYVTVRFIYVTELAAEACAGGKLNAIEWCIYRY